MDYVKIPIDDGTANPDMILREDGLELRRAPTPEWSEFEKWLADGNEPLDALPRDKWAKLNAEARLRSPQAMPTGAAIPLPPELPPRKPDPVINPIRPLARL